MIREKLTFIKDNGQKIIGEAFIPDKTGKYPTVIFSHGFGSNYREFIHHGEGFNEEGLAVIFFDFCGGGLESLSDGKMTEMTPLTEVEDLECVLSETKKLPYVDCDRLSLQGESMGGFVSAIVASEHPEIKSLVLWYPAFVIPDDSKKRFAAGENVCFGMELSPKFNTDTMDLDIYGIIAGYKGPVHIIHGDEDPVVPISYSYKAVEAYDDAKLTVIKGAGHGYGGEDSDFARNTSIEFIMEVTDYER